MTLLEQLLAEIRARGPMTFARYMELCLYHPHHGYYRKGITRTGRRGDFYTSAQLQPAFARLLVTRWVQMWRELGGGEFTVVEMGAGQGDIQREVQSWTAAALPEFSRALRYAPLEYGAPLPASITGCIFSNEFFDAQPVHVLRFAAGRFEEMLVTEEGGRLRWISAPLSSPQLGDWLERLPMNPAERQIIELSPVAAQWMERFGQSLARGWVLTFDYGYWARELSKGKRFPAGSLMTYRKHAASDSVFDDPGERDLTAHVNWDMLITAGEAVGLRPTRLSSQGSYLLDLGEADQFASLYAGCDTEAERRNVSLSLKNLLVGIGETMQVLEQRK